MSQYNKKGRNIFNLHQDKFDFFLNKYVKNDFIKAIKKELGQ